MWKNLPRWAKQMVLGLTLGFAAVGLRQAAFYLFPPPAPSEEALSPDTLKAEIDKSPFTKASLALHRSVTDDYHFVDQDGKPFNPADWYDKPMVVGFIFTNCEEVCPAMNVAIKRIVASMSPVQLGEDFRILMVGFDTERDNDPAALTKFGKKFTDDFTNYRFVSGDPAEVARFADRLGIVYEASPQGATAGWLHFVGMTIVANNQVYKQIFGPAPLPEEILGPVMEAQGKPWAAPTREPQKLKKSHTNP